MNRMRHSTPPIHRTFTFVLGLLALGAGVNAQLSVSPQADLQQLAQAITGTGVTISNPSITCHAEGFGEYSYAGSGMSINEGVLLTTGRINDALGPNNAGNRTFQAGTPGDPLLNLVTGRTTYDACKFEFDIIPTGDSLRFDFTFASEEYNEWVGSQYNDVFGFFISGPGIVGDAGAGNDRNIALVPGTTTPVTINNVNNGANAAYYDDNTGGSETQYDGFTVGLYAEALVQPCQTYHLKLIVADASDRKFDGGVFIEKIQSPTVSLSTYTQNGTPDTRQTTPPRSTVALGRRRRASDRRVGRPTERRVPDAWTPYRRVVEASPGPGAPYRNVDGRPTPSGSAVSKRRWSSPSTAAPKGRSRRRRPP